MADEFCLKMPDFHVTFRDLLHAVNLRHGTKGFTSLPKEGVLRIFFALKNLTTSAGFEPANLGTKGQHATSRPPKPLVFKVTKYSNYQTKTGVSLHGSDYVLLKSKLCGKKLPDSEQFYFYRINENGY